MSVFWYSWCWHLMCTVQRCTWTVLKATFFKRTQVGIDGLCLGTVQCSQTGLWAQRYSDLHPDPLKAHPCFLHTTVQRIINVSDIRLYMTLLIPGLTFIASSMSNFSHQFCSTLSGELGKQCLSNNVTLDITVNCYLPIRTTVRGPPLAPTQNLLASG